MLTIWIWASCENKTLQTDLTLNRALENELEPQICAREGGTENFSSRRSYAKFSLNNIWDRGSSDLTELGRGTRDCAHTIWCITYVGRSRERRVFPSPSERPYYCVWRTHGRGKAILRHSSLGWVAMVWEAPQLFLHFLSPHHEEKGKTRKKKKIGMLPCGCVLKYHLHQNPNKALNCLLLTFTFFSFTWVWVDRQLYRSTFSTSASSVFSGVEQSSLGPVENHTFSWFFTLSSYVHLLHSCFARLCQESNEINAWRA